MNGLLTFCRFPEPTSKRSQLVTSPVHFKVCSRVLATATMTTRVSSRCCFDCCCFLFVCFFYAPHHHQQCVMCVCSAAMTTRVSEARNHQQPNSQPSLSTLLYYKVKTLPKAQPTLGLSSYHKLLHKS